MAIATQQYLELLARGGNRYRSFLYSFFGVTSPDASLQIPQYLSGKRIPIKISGYSRILLTTKLRSSRLVKPVLIR